MAKVLPLAVLALLVVGCKPKEDTTVFKTESKTRALTGPEQPLSPPKGSSPVPGEQAGAKTPSPASSAVNPSRSPGAAPGAPISKPGGMSSMPGMSGPPEAPAWPKADETLTKKWEKGGSSLELVGVCHITEDDIRAWNADGEESSELKSRVESSLSSRDTSSIQLRYGKKNRLLVFKSTQTYSMTGPGIQYGAPRVEGVGARRDYNGGSSYLNLGSESMRSADQNTSIDYQTFFVAADPSESTTVAHLVQTEAMSATGTLPLKVGAAVTVEGVTMTIASISKGGEDSQTRMMYGQPGATWTVKVKLSGPWPEGVRFSASLGQGMQVDGEGNPLSEKQMMDRQRRMTEMMQKGGNISPGSLPVMRYGQMQEVGGLGAGQTYSLSVNPKHVKELVVRGTRQRRIDITNIPLDPK